MSKNPPTVFHITHQKAGSQWVRAVLAETCPDRFIDPDEATKSGVFSGPALPGGIYSPLYVTRGNFLTWEGAKLPHRKFVVIRDLRDTLVSWYFSLRYSHPTNDVVASHRARLRELSVEDGLDYLLTHPEFFCLSMVPATWRETDDLLVRYEDLLEDPQSEFARIFDYCEIGVPKSVLRDTVDRAMFERSAGRPRGQEDQASHFRKGIAGDWKNHFTPRTREAFNERWGDLLMKLGYETNPAWHLDEAVTWW